MDARLELPPGHGIAECVLGDLVNAIRKGDFGLIEEGWESDDPAETRAVLEALAAKWGKLKNCRAGKGAS